MRKVNYVTLKYLLPFILIPLCYFPGYISSDLLKRATEEDGFYENMGALFFLLTAIVFFILSARPDLYRFKQRNGKYAEQSYFLVLGVLFVFAFGEEISWGQRIIGFDTPEAIQNINVQGEFNLHNMEIFHHSTPNRIKKTGFLALLTMSRLFYLFFLLYLLVIPVIYRFDLRFKKFVQAVSLPLPSVLFGALFIFNILFAKMLRSIYEKEIVDYSDFWGFAEVKETVFSLILFALPLSWIKFKKRPRLLNRA